MKTIEIKRVYDTPNSGDGFRILIDRLWPRGLTKEKAKVDLWLKSIGPSAELREWFNHDPEKWKEFKKRYFAELRTNTEAIAEILKYIKKENVTFLFASKEQRYNNAVALKEFIEKMKK